MAPFQATRRERGTLTGLLLVAALATLVYLDLRRQVERESGEPKPQNSAHSLSE